MRWQVVMNEKLSREKEERYVVNSPDEEEESSVIPEAITDSWQIKINIRIIKAV